MLELTFGRAGKSQQIATVLSLLENHYYFTADELQMITQASEDDIKDLIGELHSQNLLQTFPSQTKIYYGPCREPSGGDVVLITGEKVPLARQDEDRLRSEIETLERELVDLDLNMECAEQEIEELDALTDKWTQAAIEVFQDLQKAISVPIRLEDLVCAAGFKPDDFDFDYEELNANEDALKEDLPDHESVMMYD